MPYIRDWADEEAERIMEKLGFDQTTDIEDLEAVEQALAAELTEIEKRGYLRAKMEMKK